VESLSQWVIVQFIGHDTQAAIISLLLFFNVFISFHQENRSQNALALLKKKTFHLWASESWATKRWENMIIARIRLITKGLIELILY